MIARDPQEYLIIPPKEHLPDSQEITQVRRTTSHVVNLTSGVQFGELLHKRSVNDGRRHSDVKRCIFGGLNIVCFNKECS